MKKTAQIVFYDPDDIFGAGFNQGIRIGTLLGAFSIGLIWFCTWAVKQL